MWEEDRKRDDMSWLCKSRNTIIRERTKVLDILFDDLYEAWNNEHDVESMWVIAWHLKCTHRAIKRMNKLMN